MKYRVLENERISMNYFRLTMDVNQGAPLSVPGQFYNIRCGETKEPLLRRPFSMHRLITKGHSVKLQILYRVIGKGTSWLSSRKNGENLDIIGPFGNGFIIEENIKNFVLVARGVGIAPIYAVGEALRLRNQAASIAFLMGARTKERLLYEEELSQLGEVFFYTDDGSRGFQGRAPELILHLLRKDLLPKETYLYGCGPAIMLKELGDVLRKFPIQGQITLESHLGCGFGACLGCALPLKPQAIRINKSWKKPALQWSEDGSVVYSLLCKDGPVYDINEVDWDVWLS
jgi:dihydroorotate dehydrogenase electron transfer subunit